MSNQEITNEMSLRDYIRIIFRQKTVIILSFICVVGFVYLSQELKTPVYKANVKMLISADKMVQSKFYQELASIRNVQAALTQSEVVNSTPVLERTVSALHLDQKPLDYEKEYASPLKAKLIDMQVAATKAQMAAMPPDHQTANQFRKAVRELRRNISVQPIRDTNMFTITVSDYNPIGAAVTANVVSRAYVIYDLQQQLAEIKQNYGEKHPMVVQLRRSIDVLTQNLSGSPLPAEDAIGPASVKIIEQASIPKEAEGLSKNILMIGAVMMSLFLGFVLAFIFEFLDQSVKSSRDVEHKLGLMHLGSIPYLRFNRQILLYKQKKVNFNTSYCKAFVNIAEQLRMLTSTRKVKTLLFSEIVPEGIATAIANVGFALSQYKDKRILIIEANFRKRAPRSKKQKSEPGFFELSSGHIGFNDAVKEVSPNLFIMRRGSNDLNPMTFLESDKTQSIINEAKSNFDIVLIEAPDMKTYKDALLISRYTDGMIVLISEAKTRLPVIKWVLKPIYDAKVNVLGVLLNKTKLVIPKFIYERI